MNTAHRFTGISRLALREHYIRCVFLPRQSGRGENTTGLATDAETMSATNALDQYLKDACDSCMPKGRYRGGKKPVYWWTQGIARLREGCKKARRGYKRGRFRPNGDQEQRKEDFRKARKELKVAIRKSKKASWDNLCKQVETDPWGLPYKLVTKKQVGRRPIPGLSTPGRIDSIADALFLREAVVVWLQSTENLQVFSEVTCDEIRGLSNRISRGKAPEPDGVLDLVIREIAINQPKILRNIFNICLRDSVFLHPWKVAKLVLLRKGDKPLDDPSSYRPICLLNTVGKLFERIIKARIEKQLEENGNLYDR